MIFNMKKILIVLTIFVLAFSVRLIFITNMNGGLEADETEYDRLASNLVESKGYINSFDGVPTSHRPPLYPVFLALIYTIFGHNYAIARLGA